MLHIYTHSTCLMETNVFTSEPLYDSKLRSIMPNLKKNPNPKLFMHH